MSKLTPMQAARSAFRCFPLALTLLFTAMPGMAAAAPSDRAARFEAQSYQQDFNVSTHIAERNLDLQARGAGVVTQIEEALGHRYAGAWFDNEHGEFVIPILGGEGRAEAADEFAATGLGSDFRTVRVESTWAELEAAHERIDDSLRSLIEEGLAQTGLDPRMNAVVIFVATSMGKTQRAELRRLAAGSSVAVEVRQGEVDRFRAEPVACQKPNCGNPLRGGVGISRHYASGEFQPNCSAGFKAVGNATGNRYVLTAGHCAILEPGAPNITQWSAADEKWTVRKLGFTENAVFGSGGDWAKINANGTYWDVSNWPSQVAWWGVHHEYPIQREGESYVGQYVCHSGKTTGASCGYVTVKDYTAGYGVPHLTKFAGSGLCLNGGDSGGPVFISNTAFGLVSGMDAGTPECNRTGYFAEITEATDALGVSVAPRQPSPASWDGPINLGGQIVGEPDVSSWGNGRLDVFATGTNGALHHKWYTNSSWSSWENLGGVLTAGPGAVSWGSNRIDVVGRTTNGDVAHWWYDGSWHLDYLGGAIVGSPDISSWGNGRLDVFATGTNGALHHKWYANGSWSSWQNLGGNLTSGPGAVSWGSNRIDVVGRTTNGDVAHWWYDGSWHLDYLGGAIVGSPDISSWGNGRLDVFATGTNGALHHKWYANGSWSSWENLGGNLTAGPGAVSWGSNRIDIFGRANDGSLAQWWYGS